MPIDYAAVKKAWTRFKAALTRAKNSKDPDKVIAAIDAADAWFTEHKFPHPDAWPHWESLRDSALMSKRYGYPYRG